MGDVTQSQADDVQAFWDQHYGQRDRLWSGRPNPVLVEMLGSTPPGVALDLGCGEGADAVWLAEHGWRVTAVDVSTTALARAEAAVEEAGMTDRVSFEKHDLARTFPEGDFDLVSAQFLQSPLDFPRAEVLRRAAAAIVPGGLLLIVDHAAPPPWAKNVSHDHYFPPPEEVFAELGLPSADWDTERLGTAQREAVGPEGQKGVLTDGVIALRRRA